MPHTSSRRRQRQMAPHSTKLVPQVADDGWTHVVRKSASPAASSSTICTAVANASNSIHATGSDALLELLTPAQLELYNSLGWQGSQDDVGRQTGPRPQQPRCSELELNKKLGHVRSAWRGSTICKRIKNVLVEAGVLHVEDPADALASLSLGGSVNMEAKREALEPEDSYNKSRVDKVICLGLGSPNADPSGWRSTVLWQLAAFLEIAELCMYSSVSPKSIFPRPLKRSSTAKHGINVVLNSILTRRACLEWRLPAVCSRPCLQ